MIGAIASAGAEKSVRQRGYRNVIWNYLHGNGELLAVYPEYREDIIEVIYQQTYYINHNYSMIDLSAINDLVRGTQRLAVR